MSEKIPAGIKKNGFFLMVFFLIFLLSECNKPLTFVRDTGMDSVAISLPKKKLLLIAVAGAKGSAMKSADIPNIRSLLAHSLYSWDAVCDTISTDQAGWANLFTGTDAGKNGTLDGSYAGNKFSDYPTFIARLKNQRSEARIISISDDPSLNDTLITPGSVDAAVALNDDKTVKDSAVGRLQHDDPDVMVVSFNGVNRAGTEEGYSDLSPGYLEAIHQVDGYVGEIIAALKGRMQAAPEDWMIIITSNHGGKADGTYGGASQEERNNFVLYYNLQLTSSEVKMPLVNVPYSGKFPFFYRENGEDHAAYSGDALYHFGADQDFTIEFNILAGPSDARRDNPIITNKNWNSGNNTGWIIYIESGNIRINYKGADASRIDMRNGPVVEDGKWHHITITFNRQENISIYMDGKFYVSGPSIKDNGNVDAGYPLVVGTHGTLDFNYYGYNVGSLESYVSDVRVWNTVLSPELINDWAFIPVTADHPDYSSLVGYWRMMGGEDADTEIKSSLSSRPSLEVSYGLKWNEVDGVLNPSDIDATQFVPHSVDIAVNAMAWMGLKIMPEWKLDGKLWILQ